MKVLQQNARYQASRCTTSIPGFGTLHFVLPASSAIKLFYALP